MTKLFFSLTLLFIFCSCENADEEIALNIDQDAILSQFSGTINLKDLPNYENQEMPAYIRKDNTSSNPITNEGAVLGRVLFYDKNLSVNNTISCSSCHQQALAFGDDAIASDGVNGTTGRHSMRLINARFFTRKQLLLGRKSQYFRRSEYHADTGPCRNGLQRGGWQ